MPQAHLYNLLSTSILGGVFCLLSFFYSCRKKLPLESTATLSFAETDDKVEEGNYLEYSASLSNGLLEDLVLQLTFDTEDYDTDYANPEDYTSVAFYSTDGGGTWRESRRNILNITTGIIDFRIRILTLDDAIPEIKSEKFTLRITVKNTDEAQIVNAIPSLTASIIDNDVVDDLRVKIDGKRYALVFRKQQGKFKPYGASSKAKTQKEKAFIDGDYKAPLELVSNMIDATGANVIKLFFGFKSDSSTVGAVDYIDDDSKLSKWVMYLNMAPFSVNKGQLFNKNGRFAATVVHELGHVLTLNNTQRRLVENTQECQETFVSETEEKSYYFLHSYATGFLHDFYSIETFAVK